MQSPDVPFPVLSAYGFEDATLTPITIGLINRTLRVDRTDGSRAILQRLHPIFAPEVNLDLDAITTHLAARGLTTPRLVRTRDGAPYVDEGGTWRALTYVDGTTHAEVRSPALALEAGRLAGRFHHATTDLAHEFAFQRGNVHDTPRHLARLRDVASAARSDEAADREALELADDILAWAESLAPLPEGRRRIVHGDLKITNLLFEHEGERGLALVDLDTMAHGSLAIELGDALRSWCNPAGESAADARCDATIVRAAITGFREAVGSGCDDELIDVPRAIETIALELAARFATDAFEDRYFGWDPSRFPSRIAHNRARARSQLVLARSVADAVPELEDSVHALLGRSASRRGGR